MKTILVGDLHGRIEIVEKVLKHDCNIVFIGDYLDSYDRSIDDQIQVLKTVLEAVTTSDGRIQALYGNHELSYLDPAMRCSGFNHVTSSHIVHMDLSPLKYYTWVEGYLVSHAGVSQHILEDKNSSLNDYLEKGDFHQIGRARGGRDGTGGLLWCDWFSEFKNVPDVFQIVGHSGYRPEGFDKGILETGGSYNIDCLEHVENVLVVEKGKEPTILTLEIVKGN